MFVAAVAEGLVLDPAADLVEGVVAQPHHVERVRDLFRLGRRRVERGPVRAREVQHRPADLLAPTPGPRQQPPCGRSGGSAWDYVQQLAPPDVDDAGRPDLGAEPAPAPHQVLVEAQRLGAAAAAGSANAACATPTSTPCRTQRDPPTPPAARRCPTTAPHRTRSPVSAPDAGCAPATARRPRRRRRAPPHRPVPPAAHRHA